ncbi:hypothetical protein [Rubrivirga sp.]|uniref:hypothetical protein n=1 Tax=Rubrivirga sp. TaxID=1885344 RepID=UPI003C75D7AA
MADTSYKRKSPFGIALLIVSVIALLFAVFLMSQRGGETTGGVGTEIDAPERLEPSEAGVPVEDGDGTNLYEGE